MKYIPYGRQLIDNRDIEQVVRALKSDWLTQGPIVQEFEEALAVYCGAKYAVAVSSGTAALHLACLASGLKAKDEAITSPVTFLATANSVVYAGARPVFADIDYATANIDPQRIKEKITHKTKAILPVHIAGLPCDMEKICAIARKNRLIVIEDACHALGAKYKSGNQWVKVGSCRHSDMTVFSFHPVKHITTGEGGVITTNSKKYYEILKALRSHGMYKDAKTAKIGPWYYEMRHLGFNYRITDFQCALGMSQLKKISFFLKRRNEIADIYDKAFRGMRFVDITETADNEKYHAYHLYVLKIDYSRLKITRKGMMEELKKRQIATQVHYIPLYRQPFYKNLDKAFTGGFNESEKYYEKALSIPMYAGMSDGDASMVACEVRKLLI